MKQFFLLILMLILVVSCKKERVVEHQSVAGFQLKTKPAVVLNTDTIYFSYTADDKEPEEYAIIKLVEQKFTKDSLSNSKFRIEFIQKKQKVFSDLITIKGIEKGSEWYGMYELDSVYSPFKRLSFGYPACGYSQDNFLYYIEGSASSKIHTWLSVGDGGWFNDVDFFPISKTKFACRTASFWPEETETENLETDEEFGMLEFSDSIVFSFTKNQWNKSFKTPKGKVYRKTRMSYDSMIN